MIVNSELDSKPFSFTKYECWCAKEYQPQCVCVCARVRVDFIVKRFSYLELETFK